MTIYFVRHCAYNNPLHIYPGRLPIELSEKGKKQAQQIHVFLKDKKIAKIYSSAVLRCKQTSEILSNNSIPIGYDVRLLEVLSAYQGYWIDAEVDSSHYYSHQKELGGDTFEEIQARIVEFFSDIAKKNEGNIVVCSHADPLYFLFLHLTGKALESVVRMHPDTWENYPKKGEVRSCIVENGKFVSTSIVFP